MPAEGEPAAMESRDVDGEPQQFCLRWNNYQTNLTNCFDQLLRTQSFVDVTLSCEGQSLKAHKVVLSACSPYFQSLLMDNPCNHPIIIMRDIKFSDLKSLVDFMYRGEINVAQDQIQALLNVAGILKVRGLADVSADHAVLRPPKRPPSGAERSESPSKARRRGSSEHSPRRSPATPGPALSVPGAPERDEHAAAALPLHADDVDIRPGIAEMIREEERDDDEEPEPLRASALRSSLSRRTASGYAYQQDLTRAGDFYVELKVYNRKEAEKLGSDRWKQVLLNYKASLRTDSATWKAVADLVVAAKAEFKGIQPILYPHNKI